MAKATYVRGQGDLSDEYVKCKGALRHAWEEWFPTGMQTPLVGFRLSLRCTRCSTERHDVIHSKTGDLLSREYRYPDGYIIRGVSFPTGTMRLELFDRIKDRLAKINAIGNGAVKKQQPAKKAAPAKKQTKKH